MSKSIKLIIAVTLFIHLYSCSEPIKEEVAVVNEPTVIEVEKMKSEVMSVENFNQLPPFFSVLEKPFTEWKTITQANDSEKEFHFNASTIFVVNDEIIKSKIVNDDIIIQHGIHTGMSREKFESHFEGLTANNNPSEGNPVVRLSAEEVYISCCTEDTQYWKFSFLSDTLYQVEYYQYYD